jgi:hypothetical protein
MGRITKVGLILAGALGTRCLVVYDYGDYELASGGGPAACQTAPDPAGCRACRDDQCQAVITSCTNDMTALQQCPPWLDCVDDASCEDAQCVAACNAQVQGQSSLRDAVVSCTCENCAQACGCFACP